MEAPILDAILINPATQSTVVPFAVALVVVALVRLIGGERRGPRFVVVSAVISFLVAYAVVEGVPALPAAGAKQKVFFLVIGGLALGLLLDLRERSAVVETIAIIVAPALALLWMAQRLLSFGLELDVWLPLLLLWATSIVILWRLSQAMQGGVMAPGIQILVASAGLSVIALVGASASLAQLSAALAAAMGAVLLWAFVALALFGLRYGFGALGLFGAGGALLALSYVLVLFTDGVSLIALAILVAIFFADLAPLNLRFGGVAVQRALRPVALTLVAAVPAVVAVGVAVLTGEGASPY